MMVVTILKMILWTLVIGGFWFAGYSILSDVYRIEIGEHVRIAEALQKRRNYIATAQYRSIINRLERENSTLRSRLRLHQQPHSVQQIAQR